MYPEKATSFLYTKAATFLYTKAATFLYTKAASFLYVYMYPEKATSFLYTKAATFLYTKADPSSIQRQPPSSIQKQPPSSMFICVSIEWSLLPLYKGSLLPLYKGSLLPLCLYVSPSLCSLFQELHDIKLVLERTGTITPRSPTHRGPPPVITTHPTHPTPHPAPRGRVVSVPSATVGPVVTAYSEGDSGPGSRQGEASVFVDDHRQDPATPAARAAPATPRPLFSATMGRRQITVPKPATPQGAANGHAFPAPRRLAPQPATMGPTAGPSYGPSNGPTSVTGHSSRKVSLWNGRGAKMAVVSPRHADRQHQFRSLRVSRTSGAPSTVVRSIEDTYARGSTLRRHPVLLVQSRVPHGLQGPMQDVYIAQGALQLPPSGDVYIANPHLHHPHPHHPSPSGDVYIANPHPHHPPPSGDVYIPQGSPRGRPVTPTSSLRRSASPAGSGWVTEDTALTHNGQLDDVLL
ncbi:hypothetical protein ACOMHN_042837 [Nucella lapillus]